MSLCTGREVGAEVDDPVDAQRQELPVLVERELTVRDHVAAVRIGQQTLCTRADIHFTGAPSVFAAIMSAAYSG